MKTSVTDRLYLETSAVLRCTLEGDVALARRIDRADVLATSVLTLFEGYRDLARRQAEPGIPADRLADASRLLGRLEAQALILELDDHVLPYMSSRFPFGPVRTLDAIHLGTVLLLNREVGPTPIATVDDRIRRNAAALGLDVIPA